MADASTGGHEVRARFLVGADRSGTTLLRSYLEGVPGVFVPPESRFVPGLVELAAGGGDRHAMYDQVTGTSRWRDWALDGSGLQQAFEVPGDAADVLDRVYLAEATAEGRDCTAWIDKTPEYVFHVDRLAGLLPDSRFVVLVRDPRDVFESLKRVGWRGRTDWQIARYLRQVAHAIEQARRLGRERVLTVRYEDLVTDPVSTLAAVADHFVLDPIDRSRPLRRDPRTTAMERDAGIHQKLEREPSGSDLRLWEAADARRVASIERLLGIDALRIMGYAPASHWHPVQRTWTRALAGAGHVVQMGTGAVQFVVNDRAALRHRIGLRLRGRRQAGLS